MPTNDYANSPNMSRSEDILQSILDATEYDEPARSRIEYLLKELKAAIEGGGGGGGVTSYNALTGRPAIDNHTLIGGNNASSDLGLQKSISDLSEIRSGASLGATAVQPVAGKGLSTNDYTTDEKNKLAAIEAQANKTIVDNALNSSSSNPVQNKVVKNALDNKQAILTVLQLAAVNSGITAEKLQVDESNISKSIAALIELVDGGAKNKLSIGTPTSVPTGLTCTRNDDGTYTVSGTLSAPNSISFNVDSIDGDLILSGCPEGGGNDTYLLRITKSGSQVAGSVDTGNGSDAFTMDGTGYALNIRFAAGTYADVVFKPMICAKSAWDISHSYVPYRPSYQELYEMVLALQSP